MALGRQLFPLDPQQRRRWVRRQEKQLNEALSSRGVKLGHGRQVGTVVFRNGMAVSEGWNEVLRSKDPTAHAEIVAIRNARRKLGRYDLTGCEIDSSC